MKLNFFQSILAILLLGITMGSDAALILQGGTGSTGAGNIVLDSGTVVDTSNSGFFNGATDPSSSWVWASGVDSNVDLTFSFTFSLADEELSTATLSGLWGVDNVGTVSLNGVVLSSLPDIIASNYTTLHSFTAEPGSALFNSGINVLLFDVGNRGGPGAFRASVEVETVSAPATLAIMAFGMFGLGLRRVRK